MLRRPDWDFQKKKPSNEAEIVKKALKIFDYAHKFKKIVKNVKFSHHRFSTGQADHNNFYYIYISLSTKLKCKMMLSNQPPVIARNSKMVKIAS